MIQLLMYASVAVFILGITQKVRKLVKRMHLRCELYPIPYSHYEFSVGTAHCSKRKGKKSLFSVLKTYSSLFFINRRKMSLQPKHWFVTFLFHLGIFLHGFWILALLFFAFFTLPKNIIFVFSTIGMLGLLFILIFGIYLLIRKLRAPLRHYVPFEDYFILALALFFSFTGVLVFLESELEDYIALTREMLTPLSFPELSFSETLHTIAFSLLLLILPFTRITHYIAVFFTHLVLWDIRPANHIEAKLSEILKNCRVKWNAEHLNPEMSWKELLKQEMKG